MRKISFSKRVSRACLALVVMAASAVFVTTHRTSPTQITPFLALDKAVQHRIEADYPSLHATYDYNHFYQPDSDTASALVPGYAFKVYETPETLQVKGDIELQETSETLPSGAVSAQALFTDLSPLLASYGYTSDGNQYTDGGQTQVSYDFTQKTGDTSAACHAIFYASNAGVDIDCSNNKLLAQYARQYAPFVKLYLKQHTDQSANQLTAGPLEIKSQRASSVITASETAGYDIAEIVLSHAGTMHDVLFYKKGRSWQYATEASDEFGFPCAPIYANADMRKAFHGQVCYKAGDGQIRVDSDLRALQ